MTALRLEPSSISVTELITESGEHHQTNPVTELITESGEQHQANPVTELITESGKHHRTNPVTELITESREQHQANPVTELITESENETFEDLEEVSRQIGITWVQLINAASGTSFIHQESPT